MSDSNGEATIANGNVANNATVTIEGLANSTTYIAGNGMLVETTSTLHTYTFHRELASAANITSVANNIANVQPGGFTGTANSSTFPEAGSSWASLGSADIALAGKKKVFGVDITTISTVYGDMNVARNVHLDGTNVKMLGINMKYCAYRPLVGNGINRDTGIYVGVQTLENSGVDRRVDQILTEAGCEWSCPETHAIWT